MADQDARGSGTVQPIPVGCYSTGESGEGPNRDMVTLTEGAARVDDRECGGGRTRSNYHDRMM